MVVSMSMHCTACGDEGDDGKGWRAYIADDLDANGRLDELQVEGVVSFSEPEHCWVAAIDWSAIHHASDEHRASVGDSPPVSDVPTAEDSRARHSS